MLGFILVFCCQGVVNADVTLATTALAAGDIYQGTNNNVAYILQMDVTNTSVTLTTASIVSSGTYDSDDITRFRLYRNTTPSYSGSTYMGDDVTSTGNGETVSINPFQFRTFDVGTHYLLITAWVSGSATDNNTLHFDGGANPMSLTFTTSPNVTNNQSNNAGIKTIQATDLTLATATLAADDIYQGSSNNVAYILQMDVTNTSVTLTTASIVSSGTYDSDDITRFRLYRNTTPSYSGSTHMGDDVTSTGNGESVSINPFQWNTFDVGTHYLLLTAWVSSSATDDNTLHFNGDANPMSLTFTTSPNVTNNQSNNAGTKTIQAVDVSLSTEAVSSGSITTGTNNNIAYIIKMIVSTASVEINTFSIVSNGTYDDNDFTAFKLFRNTVPAYSGSQYIAGDGTLSGNGETVTLNPFQFGVFAIGTHYLIVTADVSTTGTNGNTLQFIGAANNAAIGFTTSPNKTDNQSNSAGLKTIFNPLPIELTSFSAHKETDGVRLEWQTASETDNSGFDVQRVAEDGSREKMDWQLLGFVAGNGTTTETSEYSYVDEAPLPGVSYYRLRQVDFAGGFEYSKTVSIDRGLGEFRLYPNPTNGIIAITNLETHQPAFLSVFDALGKVVLVLELKGDGNIDLTSVPKGIYFIITQGVCIGKIIVR